MSSLNFPRALWGYEPRAVARMFADLDRHYGMGEAALAAQIWDLCQLAALLGPAVERLAGNLPAGNPDDPAPAPPAELPVSGPSGGEGTPALTLPRRLWGLNAAEVERERNRRIEVWEQEIADRQRELSETDRERIILFRRLSELAQAADRTGHGVPAPRPADSAAAEPPAHPPAEPDPGAPLVKPLPSPARTGGDFPRTGPRRAGRAHRQPWRPGTIGEAGEAPPRELRRGGPLAARGPGALQLVRTEGRASGPAQRSVRADAHAVTLAVAAVTSPIPKAGKRPAGPDPVTGPARETDPLDQMQAGLSQRIELLYQSFLVGKVVGADLVDPAGNLLAARGSPITRDLVRRAATAGLLSVLVAQMTIPGVEVE